MSTVSGNTVSVVLTMDSAQYSKGLDQAQKQLDRFKGKTVGVRSALHGQVNDLQATSASLRLFEGRMDGSIRAAERFLTTIPGVGKGLKAAFPLVGGIAFASLMVHLGSEVADFIEKANQVPAALTAAWSKINISADSANDKLAITNDKLEEQIAKLEGKPVNNLKTVLDEAREAADTLAESLDNANHRMAQLMKDSHVSGLGGFFSGQAITSTAEGSINSYNRKIQDLADRKQEALQSGDTSGAASLDKQLHDTQNSALQWADTQLKIGAIRQKLNKYTLGMTGNYGAAISDVSGFHHQITDEMNHEALQKQHGADTHRLQGDKDKAAADKKHAEEVSKQQREAQRRAAEAKRASDKANHAHQKFYTDSVKNYRRYNSGDADIYKMQGDVAGRMTHASSAAWSRGNEKTLAASDKLVHALDKLSETSDHAHRRDQRSVIGYKAATGQMSPLAAAKGYASVDDSQYKDESARIKNTIIDLMAQLASAPDAASRYKIQSQIVTAQGAQTDLNSRYNQQQLQDRYAIEQNSIMPQLVDNLRNFAQAATNAGAVLSNFAMSMLDATNNAIIGAAQGQHGTFKQLGRQAVGMGEGTLLKGVEGFGIKALTGHGLTGKMGSKSNPMYVIDAASKGVGNALGSGISKGVSGISSALAHPSQIWSGIKSMFGGSGSGSGIGSIMSSLMSFLPHFASGGNASAGSMAMVGERGPELVRFGNNASIMPNRQTMSMFNGGGPSQTISIDARATNPAMVQSAVTRGMSMAYAASVHKSTSQQTDAARRRP